MNRHQLECLGWRPIIKDKLFIFGLIQAASFNSDSYFANTQEEIKNSTPQYLLKLDWNVTDSNFLEVTAFNDKAVDKTKTWLSPVAYGKEKENIKDPVPRLPAARISLRNGPVG